MSQPEAKQYEVVKEEREELTTIMMRVNTSMPKISDDIDHIYKTIMEYMDEAGIKETMPPFAWYHAMSEDSIDMEAGVAVATESAGNDQVKPSRLPGGTVAVVWYVGPYGNEMATAYHALESWMAAEGYEPAAGPWEVYWSDPAETAPEELRTEIVWPIRTAS